VDLNSFIFDDDDNNFEHDCATSLIAINILVYTRAMHAKTLSCYEMHGSPSGA